MRLIRSFAPLYCSALFALPLAAEEAERRTSDTDRATVVIEDEVLVEEEAPYLPEKITSATKTSTPVRLLPQSATALSAELLHEQDDRVLGDALAYTPGVNVQSQFGVHDYFVVRGLDSLSSSLILTDGAAEPEATFYRTYNLERIEVLRGSAGFLYGGGSLGALVNLVRKRPAAGSFAQLGLTGGSDSDLYATVDVNHGPEDGRYGLRLNAQWHEGDGYRDGKGFESYAINPTVSWSLGERTAMSFSAEYLSNDLTPDGGLPIVTGFSPVDFSLVQEIADVPRERSYDTPFDFSDQELVRLRFDLESRLGSGLTLRNKTYLTTLDWQSRGTLLLGAFEFPFGGPPSVFRLRNTLDDDQQVLGNQFDVVFNAQTGAVGHELVAGLEVQQYDDDFEIGAGLLPELDLLDPVETAPEEDFLFQTQSADVRTRVIAPYVHDTLSFGERWRLSLGARYDALDIDGEQAQVAFDPATGQPFVFGGETDDSDGQLSPFAGLLYAPSERLSFYANYAEAFSPQSTRALAAVVEPEEGQQVEVGLKAALFGDRARLALAAYDLEKENVAIVNPDGFTAQLGDQETQGLELELQGSLGAAEAPLRWIFSYAYTDAELTRFVESVTSPDGSLPALVDRSGNAPAFVPEHLASLWLSRGFASGLRLAGGARYVGEQFIDEDNAFELDDHVVLDASIGYRFADAWEANLWLKNLTDEETFVRGFGASSVIPANGFHLALGLRYGL